MLIVSGSADVKIGSNVDIAPLITIITGTHELLTVSGRAAGHDYSLPVSLKDGAWTGTGSTILGGVQVGTCSMISAGALANKDTAPQNIVGGVPARLIVKDKAITPK